MSGGIHLGERLSVFLDGELSPAERVAAEAHLRECASCAHELEELAAVDTLVRQEPLPAPEGYFETLPGRVRSRIRARRRTTPAVWTAAAVAAAVVLVSVVAPLTLRHAPTIGAPARPEAQRAAADAIPSESRAPSAREAVAVPTARAQAKAAPPAAPAMAKPLPAETEDRRQRLADAEAKKTRDTGALASPARAVPPPAPAAAPAGEGAGASAANTARGAARARPELKAEVAEREDSFAQAPASPEAAGAVGGAATDKSADAPAARKLGVAGGNAFAHPDRALMDDQRFRSLAARRPTSAAEARALREAWEMFARDRPDDPRADEARVRAIEAGVTAWRLGGQTADRDTARAKALAYLAVEGAPQRARVRAALDGLPPESRP